MPPYGFAEAVAPFKTICGSIWSLWFLPLASLSPPFAFTYCRSMPPQLEKCLAKHPEGVSRWDAAPLSPCSAFYVPRNGEKKKGARERLRGKKESQRERRESGGDEFGVSNNVRRIDSEGDLLSLLITHRAADHSSSLALALSLRWRGPSPGACHPAQIN